MNSFRGTANVNGTNLNYEVVGEGYPLVLLHSGYTDLRLWDFQIREFAEHFMVIRYDIRGFGKSDAPKKSFLHYQDLYELLNYLKIDRCHLLGISMGGSIAIDFTLAYPEKVNSLILSGTSISGYKAELEEQDKKRHEAGLSIVKKDKNRDKSIEYLINDSMWKQENKLAQGFLQELMSESSLEWMLQDYTQQLDPPAVDRISEIKKDVCLIVGENDSKPIHDMFQFLQNQWKTAKTAIVKDTGHLPNLDKPNQFNQVVLDFLTEIQ